MRRKENAMRIPPPLTCRTAAAAMPYCCEPVDALRIKAIRQIAASRAACRDQPERRPAYRIRLANTKFKRVETIKTMKIASSAGNPIRTNHSREADRNKKNNEIRAQHRKFSRCTCARLRKYLRRIDGIQKDQADCPAQRISHPVGNKQGAN